MIETSIINATIQLFLKGKLPYIKNIAHGDIEMTVNKVIDLIISDEEQHKKKRDIFVSGAPGSGKTLVVLQTLYDYNKKNYEENNIRFGTEYLSGDGSISINS